MQLETLNLNYWAIAPELIVSVVAVILMLMDAFSKKGGRQANAFVALLGLVAAFVSVVMLGRVGAGSYFSGMVVVDPIRIFFAVTILIVAIVAVLLAGQFLGDEGLPPGEFFSLILFATSGMLLLTAAGDLVTVFLGLEIASITTYVMAGYRRYDLRANESSLKYFLLGSFSTAFMLYGMALTYGAIRTTNIDGIRQAIVSGTDGFPAFLLISATMILVGFVTGNFAPVAFYLLAFFVVSVGAFGVIQLLARAGDQKTQIGDYAGIGFEAPALSFPLAIFLLSLAGIPSTAGFIGKFYVFKTAWFATPALRYLVVIAIINSIISIYYYLYPIVVMFFRPLAPGFVKPRIQAGTALALILTILGTFYLGLLPNRLLKAMESGGAGTQAAQVRVK